MEFPSIVHPTKFKIGDYLIKVVSYAKLSKNQAASIAMNFYRTNKFKKKDKGKIFTVITTFDEDSANLL